MNTFLLLTSTTLILPLLHGGVDDDGKDDKEDTDVGPMPSTRPPLAEIQMPTDPFELVPLPPSSSSSSSVARSTKTSRKKKRKALQIINPQSVIMRRKISFKPFNNVDGSDELFSHLRIDVDKNDNIVVLHKDQPCIKGPIVGAGGYAHVRSYSTPDGKSFVVKQGLLTKDLQALRALKDGPCKILKFAALHNRYLAMEQYDMDLFEYCSKILRGRVVDEDRSKAQMAVVKFALDAIHHVKAQVMCMYENAKLYYMDLKAENVLVNGVASTDDPLTFMLADLGSCCRAGSDEKCSVTYRNPFVENPKAPDMKTIDYCLERMFYQIILLAGFGGKELLHEYEKIDNGDLLTRKKQFITLQNLMQETITRLNLVVDTTDKIDLTDLSNVLSMTI